MKTQQHTLFAIPAMALAITLVAAGCGSDPTTAANAQPGTSGANVSANGSSTDANPTNATGANVTNERDRTNVATMETTEIRINVAVRGTPMYDERYAASKNVRGYRALLMAELEAIRTRLNDGTRPAVVTKMDQDRAADIAQGLERMDRLIKAVEESDDLTWNSIRTSQLKEAGEVRVWASEHGYKVS